MATNAILANAMSFTRPDDFTQLTNDQLDDVFRASPPGNIPVGEGEGAAIIAPGTDVSETVARFIHIFGWKGKVFEADKSRPGIGWLKNRLLITGTKAVIAEVYKAQSWLDGKDCIVLDYSHTSIVAQWIRDEIREVRPGLFLGVVYWGKEQDKAHRLIHFALKF
jgi:hypothetical protein